ncbi:MAG: hypothetical protein WD738_04430 [Pirellulales bacterium]
MLRLLFYSITAPLMVAIPTGWAVAQPPLVQPPSGGVGLNVPLDNNLSVSGWGVNQFLGNGFLMDGNAARTVSSSGFARFARYQTAVESQSTPTALPTNQDWAIEVGYKHTGAYSSINNPFFVKNFGNDKRIVALFNNGGDSWSLGVGNGSGGYDMAASQISLGTGWNRFNFHYKSTTQSIDAYLNNTLIAADMTVGHGQYNADHVQIEFTGAGTDWFSEIKIGDAVPRTRSVTFGNEWVRSHPFTLHGQALRDSSLVNTRYRDANFTNVLAWENNVGLVDKAWEIQHLPWRWHTGERPLDADLMATINSFMSSRPGGEGFVVWDEPKRNEFLQVAEVVNWIRQNYPTMLVYSNMSAKLSPIRPPWNYGQEYGTNQLPDGSYEDPPVPYDYETYIDDYIHFVQPDVLQFDGTYAFLENDPDETTEQFLQDRSYFDALGIIRKAGLRANIPYFAHVQSFDGGGHRHPSESDMRMGVFAPLAYGFKGLAYFTFDHYGSYEDGNGGGLLRALNPNYSSYLTNPTYFYAQGVNAEVARLGETLKMLDSTQVRYVLGKHLDAGSGQVVPNKLPLGATPWNSQTDDPYITLIEASNVGTIPGVTEGDVLIGHFRTALEQLDGPQFEGEGYFMIVNLLREKDVSATDASQQIHIEFDFGASGINSLQRLNRSTGQVELVPLTHDGGSLYYLDLTLPGGTGDLFKYNTGAPFIGGFVVPALPGDYNRDGAVDAADYLVWRKTLGRYLTRGDGADGDGDGIITNGDYNFWRARFGDNSSEPVSAAVPEPASVLPLIYAAIGLLFWRQAGYQLGPRHY